MDNKMNNRRKNNLEEQFVFRQILPQEADQAVAIEHICFPPHEACSEKMMRDRIARVPELFFVAVDRKTGKLAGFLNGIATNEQSFRDAFFTDAGLHDPQGSTVMLLGLDVLPEYRGQGLAREIMTRYLSIEREKGRKQAILTCLEEKVAMYERMGYHNCGLSASAWGDEQWYEMCCRLNDQASILASFIQKH
ncbi:MAG: GNAT family N-acetyltransferase [Lachnospiraceae bacterium]|nr:GNAT family N-acetyltransferase [Lachnospiraceae bacterium]